MPKAQPIYSVLATLGNQMFCEAPSFDSEVKALDYAASALKTMAGEDALKRGKSFSVVIECGTKVIWRAGGRSY